MRRDNIGFSAFIEYEYRSGSMQRRPHEKQEFVLLSYSQERSKTYPRLPKLTVHPTTSMFGTVFTRITFCVIFSSSRIAYELLVHFLLLVSIPVVKKPSSPISDHHLNPNCPSSVLPSLVVSNFMLFPSTSCIKKAT